MSKITRHHDLTPFFAPRSVAIVGVSADYRKVGHLVAKNMLLQGFIHDMYFVNAKGGRILGRDTYTSLDMLPTTPDLVVYATPADVTLQDLQKHPSLPHAVILAAGFKEEHGDIQTAREKALQEIVTTRHTRILGPNCAGFINAIDGLNTTFLVGPVPVGNVGFISQSGALGSIFIDTFAASANIGFSYFFSLGNKSDIDECDALEYLTHDPHTKVIALYLEDIHDGSRFRSVLSEATRHKPVVIIKSGTSAQGAKAASSHTGSLAGDDAIFDAVIHECAAMRARSIAELITLVKVASYGAIPKSKNMIVITNAGGCGVLAADAISQAGLKLGKLHISSDEPNDTLVPNPYDVRGDADAERFAQATAETRDEENVGGVIVIVSPQANTQLEDTAKSLVGLQTTLAHPVYPLFLGAASMDTVKRILESNRMPFFTSLNTLISSLALLAHAKTQTRAHHEPIAHTHKKSLKTSTHARTLSLEESYASLQKAGIELAPIYHAHTKTELEALRTVLTYPLVMKLSSSTITHKSDAGGVVLGIRSYEEVVQTYEKFIQLSGFESAVIQRQLSGYEIILGAKRDPIFGPVVVLGIGGVLTNLISESVSFLPPIEFPYFEEKLRRTKIYTLLNGYRGFAPVDIEQLYELVVKIQRIMTTSSLVQEIDLNPLMVGRDGSLVAVDARVVVCENE